MKPLSLHRKFFGALFLVGFVLFPSLGRATETIDILILYTPAVKTYYTDHDGVVAHAMAAFASANLGLANSGLDVEFRLVHVAETNYAEGKGEAEDPADADIDSEDSIYDLDEDLRRLSEPTDGIMDEAHTLRNEWGADLVCLFRDGNVNGNAGLANLLSEATFNFSIGTYNRVNDQTAFSVVEAQSAITNLTFHHEIGHNLGGGHARGDNGSGGMFDYSNGYRFVGADSETYRTIMAYSPGLLINQFSTPDLQHQSVDTGKAVGEPDSAHNVATFEISTPFTEQFRDHMTDIPEVISVSPNLTLVEGGSTIVHSNAVGTPTFTVQWYEGVSGDTSTPISGATSESMATGPVNQTSYYWLQATNPNGSGSGPTITISTTAQPGQGNTADQVQAVVQTGYPVPHPFVDAQEGELFLPFWQEIIPSQSYTDSFELSLWKDVGADPVGELRVQLYDENSHVIYEQTVLPNQLDSRFPKWISFPIKMYLEVGSKYRIQMHSTADPDDSGGNVFVWSSHVGLNNPYTAGRSYLDTTPFNEEAGFEGIDFSFRTLGSNASALSTSIVPSSRIVSSAAGSYIINVTSNTDWTVTESLSWLSVSPESGSNNGIVTVSYNANASASDRSGTITIGGQDHAITQSSPLASTSIDPTTNTVGSDAGFFDITVTSNTSWSVVESLSWASASPTSGTGNGTVTISYDANATTISRNGIVTIGGETHDLTQNGAPLVVDLDVASATVGPAGASYDVNVTSNGPWTLTETENWVSVTPTSGSGNGSFTVTVDAHTGSSMRTATIATEDEDHALRQVGVLADGMIFSDWIRVFYSAAEVAAMVPSAEEADPDGDGVSNQNEFERGLDPSIPSLLIGLDLVLSGQQIDLEATPYNPSFSHQVLRSLDLLTWEVVNATANIVGNTITFTVDFEPNYFYQVYGQ